MTRLINQTDEIDSPVVSVWPEFYVAGLKEPSSWFTRLATVATTLVTQWVLIKCNFNAPGGVPLEINDHTVRQLLLYVPTPPVPGSKPFPDFEVDNMSITQWRQDLDSRGENLVIPKLTTRMLELKETYTALEETIEDRPVLPPPTLKNAIETCSAADNVEKERIQKAL